MTVNIKNTAVQIDFWFAAVLVFLLLFFPNGNAAACFVLCVLHEIGHLSAMLILKSRPKKIQFGFFGMKIVEDEKLLSPIKEIIIAAAGPFVNLILAAVLHYFMLSEAALLSLGLGLFNLMPVSMLDGGHILLSLHKNRKAAKITDFVCCFLLLVLGVLTAVYTKRNFTVLIVSIYLLIGCVTG